MSLTITKLSSAEVPKQLNTEWFVLQNDGDKPFSTRNCVLSVRRKGQQKRGKALGTMDPGFVLAPGECMRVLTGNPGKQAHGTAPTDDIPNYSLFLANQLLTGEGIELVLSLRSRVLATAAWDPAADSGIAAR